LLMYRMWPAKGAGETEVMLHSPASTPSAQCVYVSQKLSPVTTDSSGGPPAHPSKVLQY